MGKFLGFCFFLCGVAAVYMWGVRPLTSESTTVNTPAISVVARASSTPALLSGDQRAVAGVVNAFLSAWRGGQYSVMYDDLTTAAQHRISRAAFVARYRAVMAEATVRSVTAHAGRISVEAPQATANFETSFTTQALGPVHQTNQMQMVFDHDRWGVDWYPALIFKQLVDPYVVHLVTLPAHRGSILDRHGTALAEDGQFIQVGVEPGLITDEAQLLAYMSKWLHMSAHLIKHLYTLSWAQPDYFMPITTITSYQLKHAPAGLDTAQSNGVRLEPTPGREYPFHTLASILIGYVDPASGHGKAGLEQSLDTVLAGSAGEGLYVMNQAHTMTAATIAERPAVDGQDVRLSIDVREQQALENAIGVRNGAAVAIAPSTGQVLALVSSPGYDPNRFEIGSATNGIGPTRSMFPRATLGTYPTGSVFKIVTMAAALERGGYRSDTLIDGPPIWYGLGASNPLHDWSAYGHGTISLQEALTQSCDTCFYSVAKQLDGIDESILPKFARAFGFGKPTGIDNVSEAPGLVGDNAWKRKTYNDAWRTGDTVNLSIGQGYFLATPLQVASMLASVGDHGVIRQPQLVLQIGKTKEPGRISGALPVSAGHLKAILGGMLGVTTESTGTATFVFRGFNWQVAGKTGTAQNPGAQPHAWFAAIAPYDAPRIALAVVLENAGEGSVVAGPVARKALQAYLNEVAPVVVNGAQPLNVPGG
jgi:penicillin-binding protein 2